ncbi:MULTISPECIES: hypothetical protein [unclassified Curtobacterium]|nr:MULTISPECIES: hypothetical protein [unclassified Curtobacterium]TCU83227.1 hypothetical protein EDF48_109164 [Curtobacterium sp. PhB191]TCL77205.1 hypothetical protein EDF23_108167 [Curtobacterium sp. PhB128]TCL92783.1 hypothetical protein EDF29_108166 [Curtobacterium sp. PhB138]TDW40543.1 hypothetical protein EDF52_11828 [Curtobacterium sp. PhB42]TDW51285.1 hypothetical protein EDF47_11328 [Curtobacterium sp. PhB190]
MPGNQNPRVQDGTKPLLDDGGGLVKGAVRTTGIIIALMASTVLAACSGAPVSTPTRTVIATATASAVAPPEPTADTSTPTPTATEAAFSLSDPATWTISAEEVGPIALGGELQGEIDDLSAAYTRSSDACPASPETSFWESADAPWLAVVPRGGNVAGVAVGGLSPEPVTTNSPETAAGIGVGTALAEVQSAYPDLQYTGTYGEEQGPFSLWSVQIGGSYITFQLGEDGATVGMIWVGAVAMPPYEYCA